MCSAIWIICLSAHDFNKHSSIPSVNVYIDVRGNDKNYLLQEYTFRSQRYLKTVTANLENSERITWMTSRKRKADDFVRPVRSGVERGERERKGDGRLFPWTLGCEFRTRLALNSRAGEGRRRKKRIANSHAHSIRTTTGNFARLQGMPDGRGNLQGDARFWTTSKGTRARTHLSRSSFTMRNTKARRGRTRASCREDALSYLYPRDLSPRAERAPGSRGQRGMRLPARVCVRACRVPQPVLTEGLTGVATA